MKNILLALLFFCPAALAAQCPLNEDQHKHATFEIGKCYKAAGNGNPFQEDDFYVCIVDIQDGWVKWRGVVQMTFFVDFWACSNPKSNVFSTLDEMQHIYSIEAPYTLKDC